MKTVSPQHAAGSKKLTAEHLRWFVLGLALPLLGAVITYKIFSPAVKVSGLQPDTEFSKLTRQTMPELPLPEIAPTTPDLGMVKTVEFVVRRNDTMERIFRQLQLSLEDLAAVRQMPEVKQALEMLRPGELITLIHAEDGLLRGLTRRLSNTSLLSITRDAAGFKAEVIETPLDIQVKGIRGTVTSSLFASAREAGLSADVIMRLANDIFGWDIDFALEIQPGDKFTVVYEQQYRQGEYVGDGRIIAAEFVNGGRSYRAVRYDSPDGKIGGYFTPAGRSMHKQFLRAPVDFTRISSGFNLARLHPILNTIRAHKGVDYAAPTGTPIRAAGDGRISFAGIKGGYGKVIILEHGAGIATLYGHMSRFAKSMRTGSRVRQGETIGYVGKSGAATGPHLHYEYRLNGVHKNPRTVPLPNAAPIPPEYIADFNRHSDAQSINLDRLSQASVKASPTSL